MVAVSFKFELKEKFANFFKSSNSSVGFGSLESLPTLIYLPAFNRISLSFSALGEVPLGAVLPDELAVLAPVEEADEQRRAQEGQQEPDGGRDEDGGHRWVPLA